MSARIYISNIAPAWSIARQEKLLAERVPDWKRASVFRDDLPARERRAHKPGALTQRAALLRPTSRVRGETVYVASLAVLAWSEDDFLAVLVALGERRATLHPLNIGKAIEPGAKPDAALKAFLAAKRHAQQEAAAVGGAQVSKVRRRGASDARIALIKERWGMSSDLWPTPVLLKEAGLSRNTVVERLGKRTYAQYLYERKLERRKVKNDG